MNKILLGIALVLMSSLTLAQSQITAYGRMNVYAVDQSTGAVSPGWTMSNESSRIGFRAVEKLSNGYNFRATIETSVANAAPDLGSDTKLGNRTSLVGLANKDFSVDLGRDYHAYFFVIRQADPFWARLNGSASQDILQFHDRRISNTVFVRAEPLTGLKLAVDRQLTNDVTSTGRAEATSGSVSYAWERLTLAIARHDQGSNQSDLLMLKVTTIGKGYVSLIRTDDTVALNSTLKHSKGTLLSVEQPLTDTAWTLKGSLGRTNTGITSFALGTDYAFSKTVNGRLIYRNANHTDDKLDIKQAVVGLEYKF